MEILYVALPTGHNAPRERDHEREGAAFTLHALNPCIAAVALRHQPVPPRKSATTTSEATLESGSSAGPETGSAPSMPLESAFVSAVYGA